MRTASDVRENAIHRGDAIPAKAGIKCAGVSGRDEFAASGTQQRLPAFAGMMSAASDKTVIAGSG
jgi:hypothetical protein